MARRSRGVYRAVVDDTADPLSRGRLKVSVPDVGVSGEWAEACLPPVPSAVFALPDVGSSVWVQFENGDANQPVWTGVLWETAMLAPAEIGSSGTLTLTAPALKIMAGAVDVSGVLQCDTLIAESVVSSTYTPGAGNIW